MSRTIAYTVTTGITLAYGDTPVTITNTGFVSDTNASEAAIYGPAGTAWVLTNLGAISETASGGVGIRFASAGTIANASGGVITAGPADGKAISLASGGVITNASGGTISGRDGIVATGGAATVTNAGIITAAETDSTNDSGVTLAAGGIVSNAASGVISGINGVVISGAAGTVANLGRITSNTAPANYDGNGIYLRNGGLVTNGAPGGTASAAYIGAYQSDVRFGPTGAGTLVNYGTLRAIGSAPAVLLTNGTVINGASGATRAQIHVGGNKAIEILGTGTVVNYGTIADAYGTGPGYYGVFMHGAGVVTNLGIAALIVGYNGGVYGAHDNTVTTGGTIASNYGQKAIRFAGGTNRLIVNPGARFIGTVTAAGTSTLEMASGTSAGTLTGLGTQIVGFGRISVDSGATWSLTSANLAAGYAITNAGTLNNTAGTLKSAITLGSAARLSNASTGILSVSGTAVLASGGAATVVNAGKITGSSTGGIGVYIAAGGTLTNATTGTISGVAAAAKFQAGYTNRLVIAGAAVFSGMVDGGNTLGATAVSTMELAGSGVLNSFSSQFVNFSNLTVDSGATWTLAATSTLGAGYTIIDSGNLTNAGNLGTGITLGSAGRLTNSVAGIVSTSGRAVVASAGAATVVNAGKITSTSTSGVGVYLAAGGTITNQVSGTISGAANSVLFKAGFTNRLAVAAGAVFSGSADGGDTVGGGFTSTLQLLSSASAGTLTGLGSNFLHFTNITVDPNAIWTLASGSIGSGYTITNASALTNAATLGSGITLGSGARLTNASAGVINTNGTAVVANAGPATVVNAGIITGASTGGIGIYLTRGGTITNQAGGTITGVADAVKFKSGFTSRVVVGAGAVFSGTVDGGNVTSALVSTLQLTSSASAGTLSGLGSQFINFKQVTLDPGAAWSLSGTNSIGSGQTLSMTGATLGASGTLVDNGVIQLGTGQLTVGDLIGTGTATIGTAGTLSAGRTVASGETISFSAASGVLALGTPTAFAGTIANIVSGDTIELLGISNVTNTDLVNGNTLHVGFSTGAPADLLLAGSFTGDFFHFSNTGGNSFITEDTTPCFLAGTLILTDDGERPVEDLRIGDRVINRFGAHRPIKWIGTRSYANRFVAGNPNIQPICFTADALADDVPKRDLWVSPQHAMFVDGHLVPAHLLVNGTSITRVEAARRVDYFHIELDDHDVIFAEGAPAETFLDCDSRRLFQNMADYVARYSEAETTGAACAPLLDEGDKGLAEIRARLDARPVACAWTDDSGLHLLADGVKVLPETRNDGRVCFTLTELPRTLWLASRRANPREAGISGDLRRLGVAVTGLTLNGPNASLTIAPGSASLADGFHRSEEEHRWTDGAGVVPTALLEAAGAPLRIELGYVALARYPVASAPPVAPKPAEPTVPAPLTAVLPADRPRVLVIDAVAPELGTNAGANAILDHMRSLQALGLAVWFTCPQPISQDSLTALAAVGATPLSGGSVEAVLSHHAGQFEMVYLHRLEIAAGYTVLVRKHCPQAHIVFSVADLHALRLERQAAVEGDDALRALAAHTRIREHMAAWSADAVITHSAFEAALLRQAVRSAAVHVVPWSVAPGPRLKLAAFRRGVAFIGGFAHPPNIDAADWLVRAVMPLVWQRVPDMPCYLVGSAMPEAVRRLAGPLVHALGQVESLQVVFNQVRLTVAPLRFGAGIKGKVLDSLAAGVPCVCTPVAAEGITALEPEAVETPEALASRIVMVHEDLALHGALAKAGRTLAAAHYGEAAVDARMAEVVAPVLQRWNLRYGRRRANGTAA